MRLLGSACLVLLFACGGGDEPAIEANAAGPSPGLSLVLEESQACETDDECVAIDGSCSLALGCYVFVREDQAEAVTRAIRQEEFDLEGGICTYDCAPPPDATCSNGRCQAD